MVIYYKDQRPPLRIVIIHLFSVFPVLSTGTKIFPVPALFIPVPVTGTIILLSLKLELEL